MKASTQHLLVGGFTLSGIGLALAAVVALGSGIWRDSLACETYLQESVQGLEKGSQVRFRGVQLGEVTRITLSNNKYQTEQLLVVVEFALHPPTDVSLEEFNRRIVGILDEGLHLRLASQGITGALYLEADLKPSLGTHFPEMPHEWEPDRLYIPSDTSTIERLSASLSGVMDDLGKARLHETVDEFRRSLSLFNRELASLRLGEIGSRAREFLDRGNDLMPKIETELVETGSAMRDATATLEALASDLRGELHDGRVASLLDNFNKTLTEIQRTTTTTEATMAELSGTLRSKGRDIDSILANLREITQDMARLGSTMERYPSWLFLGTPPLQRGGGR